MSRGNSAVVFKGAFCTFGFGSTYVEGEFINNVGINIIDNCFGSTYVDAKFLSFQGDILSPLVSDVPMETKKQIDQYVSLLYNIPMDRVALCLIRGQAVQHRFLAVKDIGKFIPFLQTMNCQGWNIYITPSVMKAGVKNRTKDSFMPEQDVIYVDADNKRAMEKVRAKYPYPTLVVKTSIGHYHIYWKLDEKISVDAQEGMMRLLVQDIGADPAAIDVSRVLRLPGFWHKGKDNTVDIVFSRDGKVSYKSFPAVLTRSAIPTLPTNCTRSGICAGGVQKRDVYISDIVGRDGEKLVFPSKSEEDWYLVNEWLRQGVPRKECIERLKLRRVGEKKDVDYYAKKTLENALKKLLTEKLKYDIF